MSSIGAYAGVLSVAAAAGSALAHGAARQRRPDRDCGDFWAAAVRRICIFLGPPSLVSSFIESIGLSWWKKGLHLHFDRAPDAWIQGDDAAYLALAIPIAAYAIFLVWGLLEKPRARAASRWIAGSVGFSRSRAWIILCAIPFAAIAAVSARDLGGGADGYPGVVWGTLLVLILSLIGVGLSSGTSEAEPAAQKTAATDSSGGSLPPWPAAMNELGIELSAVGRTIPAERSEAASTAPADALRRRLAARGQGSVAPEVIEAVQSVVEGASSGTGSTLLVAPDGAGQLEAIVAAAELVAARMHEITLVVVPHDAPEFLENARRAKPSLQVMSAVVAPNGKVNAAARLWIVDAVTLSEHFLKYLASGPLARVGLIVWWNAHEYSGVYAANVWAISRRLERLVAARGRAGTRFLAVVRHPSDPREQLGAFVRRLLPHEFDREVTVPARFARKVTVHHIQTATRFLEKRPAERVRVQEMTLAAGLASRRTRWPTFVERPAHSVDREWADLEQEVEPMSSGVQAMAADPATASVLIRELGAGDALSLRQAICQIGRASAQQESHVGLVLPLNPYVNFVVSRVLEGPGPQAYRRLVCAGGQESVIERHLLLRLSEAPELHSMLLSGSLWNEAIVRRTLELLLRSNRLNWREVRYLDAAGRAHSDRLYESTHTVSTQARPLDTIGAEPIIVRDPTVPDPHQGVCMMVDRERMWIDAYPGRIFTHRGRRYQVKSEAAEHFRRQGWLPCGVDDFAAQSARMRHSTVRLLGNGLGLQQISAPGGYVSRGIADLEYSELVTGVFFIRTDPATGAHEIRERTFSPLTTQFKTRGVILHLPAADTPLALDSIAVAMRTALPVHLGVEESALEVVSMTHGRIAIVDLYPGGIGLAEEVVGDDHLWLGLLHAMHDWLEACCDSPEGCERCLRSIAASAANPGGSAERQAALAVLGHLVGPRRPERSWAGLGALGGSP